mgnify:CR=1 FL=1
MRNFLILFFVLLASFPAMSQFSPTLTKEQAAVVNAAQKAALQAVNFSQGDAEALKSARAMKQVVSYQPLLESEDYDQGIVGRCEPMQNVFKLIGQLAASDATARTARAARPCASSVWCAAANVVSGSVRPGAWTPAP